MAEETVGTADDGIAAPYEYRFGNFPFGTIVTLGMHLRHVGNHEVSGEQAHDGSAWRVARVAGQESAYVVWRTKRHVGQPWYLPYDVSASAGMHRNRLASEVLRIIIYALFDNVVCFIPRDALPCILAAIGFGPLHRILETAVEFERFDHVQTAHAKRALAESVARIAFNLGHFSVFKVAPSGDR